MGAEFNSKPRARMPSRTDIPREELVVVEEELDPRFQAELNRIHRQWQWEFDQLRASMSVAPPKPTQNGARSLAPSKPPSAPKAHWLAHLAAALTSFGAATAVVVTLIKAVGDLHVPPPGMATKQDLADLDKRCLARAQALSQSQLNFRNQVLGVWELQGVKTQDPPGSPPRKPVGVLPPPAVTQTRRGSSKIPAAPMIQIDEPIASPPTFDTP